MQRKLWNLEFLGLCLIQRGMGHGILEIKQPDKQGIKVGPEPNSKESNARTGAMLEE